MGVLDAGLESGVVDLYGELNTARGEGVERLGVVGKTLAWGRSQDDGPVK